MRLAKRVRERIPNCTVGRYINACVFAYVLNLCECVFECFQRGRTFFSAVRRVSVICMCRHDNIASSIEIYRIRWLVCCLRAQNTRAHEHAKENQKHTKEWLIRLCAHADGCTCGYANVCCDHNGTTTTFPDFCVRTAGAHRTSHIIQKKLYTYAYVSVKHNRWLVNQATRQCESEVTHSKTWLMYYECCVV